MTDVTETATIKPGSWRELLGPKHLGASTVLAGGVALYATNEFLTISLLPSAVADIGGQRFYAWVTPCTWSARWWRRPRSTRCSSGSGRGASYLLALAVFGVGRLALRAGTEHGAAAGRPARCRARRVACSPASATR